eukprot:COSAG02_NODE_154_length_33067_cov_38.282092_9_plen_685_part_00
MKSLPLALLVGALRGARGEEQENAPLECNAADCCHAKIQGMCAGNTHDAAGNLMGEYNYVSTDFFCPRGYMNKDVATSRGIPIPATQGEAVMKCCSCERGYHVVGNSCVACPYGRFRPAGDDPVEPDTVCVANSRCGSYTCPTSMKLITDSQITSCASNDAETGRCTAGSMDNDMECCEPSTCLSPAVDSFIPMGYAIETNTGTTVSELGAISCASGYVGTPLVTCDSEGGSFAFSGCAARVACSTATCPAGYIDDASASAALCVGATCDFTTGDLATCCHENVCTPPRSSAPDGYVIGIDTGGTVSGLGTVRCAFEYAGTALVTCDSDGGPFGFSGCSPRATCGSSSPCPAGYSDNDGASTTLCVGATCDLDTSDLTTCCSENTCTPPQSSVPEGYTVSASAGTTVSSLGIVECSPYGYAGTAIVTCETEGGSFTFDGCSVKTTAQYCTDAADTDNDDDSMLDNFVCDADTFALPMVIEECTPSTGTGTCIVTTPATEYELLSYVAHGVPSWAAARHCTATDLPTDATDTTCHYFVIEATCPQRCHRGSGVRTGYSVANPLADTIDGLGEIACTFSGVPEVTCEGTGQFSFRGCCDNSSMYAAQSAVCCHGFSTEPSVVSGSCTECTGSGPTECANATCAEGFHSFVDGKCSRDIRVGDKASSATALGIAASLLALGLVIQRV